MTSLRICGSGERCRSAISYTRPARVNGALRLAAGRPARALLGTGRGAACKPWPRGQGFAPVRFARRPSQRCPTRTIDPLELAALVASRVCHDIISPVGAIVNGLEVLEEEKDESMREFADGSRAEERPPGERQAAVLAPCLRRLRRRRRGDRHGRRRPLRQGR